LRIADRGLSDGFSYSALNLKAQASGIMQSRITRLLLIFGVKSEGALESEYARPRNPIRNALRGSADSVVER